MSTPQSDQDSNPQPPTTQRQSSAKESDSIPNAMQVSLMLMIHLRKNVIEREIIFGNYTLIRRKLMTNLKLFVSIAKKNLEVMKMLKHHTCGIIIRRSMTRRVKKV